MRNYYIKGVHISIEHIDVKFKKVDNIDEFSNTIFYNCEFSHCDLSEANFKHSDFDNCTFINCNLSMANVSNARFKNIKFIECKLVGVNFLDTDTFLLNLHFLQCIINSCSFSGLPLNESGFVECNIKDCDFINTQLKKVPFCKSEFKNVTFHNSDLRQADFRNAIGYQLDPNSNRIAKAKFSIPEVLNLLQSMDIILE